VILAPITDKTRATLLLVHEIACFAPTMAVVANTHGLMNSARALGAWAKIAQEILDAMAEEIRAQMTAG
jgi:hypothetical protein